MGDFHSFRLGDNPEANLSADERQLRALVERDRRNPVKHIGDVDVRVFAEDASKFSPYGITTPSGSPVVGRDISDNDLITVNGVQMKLGAARQLGLVSPDRS